VRRALVIAVLLFFAPVFVAACATETTDTNGAGGGAAATDKYTSASACVDDCQGSDHPNCVSICNSTATLCAVSNPGLR